MQDVYFSLHTVTIADNLFFLTTFFILGTIRHSKQNQLKLIENSREHF